MKHFIFVTAMVLLQSATFSQAPGTTVFNSNNYIEYRVGSLPIIICAPHGGDLRPANLADRSCPNIVTPKDPYTQELARDINDALFTLLGCRPHMVLCLLNREKIDMDREVHEATCDNPDLYQTWQDYHAFIYSAKQKIMQKYGRGLFIDLHAHGHDIERIELGYCLDQAVIALTDDSILNKPANIKQSSIRRLVGNNKKNDTLSKLLRGPDALGTLIAASGYPTIPSMQDPTPGYDINGNINPYKEGGYNTVRWGSQDSGVIDGIQIEFNHDIRSPDSTRKAVAQKLASAIKQFIITYIMDESQLNTCNVVLAVPLFTSLTANRQTGQTKLNWTVSNNTGVKEFRIYRSFEGNSFSFIATIQGSSEKNYSWTDNTNDERQIFYRVEMADHNNRIEKSGVVVVNSISKKEKFKVWADAEKNIRLSLKTESGFKGLIILIDLYGRKIKEFKCNFLAGYNDLLLYSGIFLQGIFVITLSDEKGKLYASEKMVMK